MNEEKNEFSRNIIVDDDGDDDEDNDIYIGGSVAEWFERRTCTSEVPRSRPALTTAELDLLSVVPSSNPRPRLEIANWFGPAKLGFLTLLSSI